MTNRKLTQEQSNELFAILQVRFEKNMKRHKGIDWEQVKARLLEAKPERIWSLYEMEQTGGEPDVVALDKKTGEVSFYDCSAESPKGRRSLCYDAQAWEERKEHKPEDSAVNMAEEIGATLLTEQQYRALQQLGDFDLKTSSWIETPVAIRDLGGALFADRRYNHVFIYHNGAQSYYAARGFRCALIV